MSPQIMLFNDFGWRGPYLGQMVSVLYEAGGGSSVVPIQCDAPFADPYRSAYLLAALVRQSPADAVWLCVVDPGVGGLRKPIMAKAGERWLVGPDNGLLVRALRDAEDVSAWEVEWRPTSLSASFHGRDLFAPVAARLARGAPVERVPLLLEELAGADWSANLWEVIYVDGFGNCMTGIRGDLLDETDMLEVAGQLVRHARTFCEATPGLPFWYVNSLGLAEIAVNLESASRVQGLEVGAAVMRA